MDWDNITTELTKKLNPDHVRKPDSKFGPKGDWLEGWHVIAEANRIFGFGAWSYTIKGLTKDSVEKADRNGKELWQAAYTCIVTLNVDGVIREDVGFGSGFAANMGDAIEGATKEAVTDALKRCLRTFGNPFGLALYDKSRQNVGNDVDYDKQADAILAKLSECQTMDALKSTWGGNQAIIADIKSHKADLFDALEAAKDAAKQRLTQPEAGHQYQ